VHKPIEEVPDLLFKFEHITKREEQFKEEFPHLTGRPRKVQSEVANLFGVLWPDAV
jgi:hypothetical protein